jgi:hypothetical protein
MRRPSDFADIPDAIRHELARRRCTIPQFRDGTVPQNLVWGELEHPGQRDLVVLCVRNRSAVTYIFWAGDATRIDVAPATGDSITIATPNDIRYRLAVDAPIDPDMPDALEHDGLEGGCCECCSTVYYRHGGRWFWVPGAD